MWHPAPAKQMTPFTSSDNEISSYKFMLCKQFVKAFPYMNTADYSLMLSSVSKPCSNREINTRWIIYSFKVRGDLYFLFAHTLFIILWYFFTFLATNVHDEIATKCTVSATYLRPYNLLVNVFVQFKVFISLLLPGNFPLLPLHQYHAHNHDVTAILRPLWIFT